MSNMPDMNGSAAAIETDLLVKRYGSFAALDGLTLKVPSGMIYGLLGPNGAGKTTAIRILCGLARADSGEARLLGRSLPDRSVLPKIGYMPQDIALYGELSVFRNLALFGEMYGMSPERIASRAKELLELVGLSGWKGSLVTALSGGMKRRVSLACAMMHAPDILFLDEPTVGVDPELKLSFWKHFEALRDGGVTVLITTHYMDEASRCDRAGFIRNGKLIAEGTPGELRRTTRTRSLEDAFLALSAGEGRT